MPFVIPSFIYTGIPSQNVFLFEDYAFEKRPPFCSGLNILKKLKEDVSIYASNKTLMSSYGCRVYDSYKENISRSLTENRCMRTN